MLRDASHKQVIHKFSFIHNLDLSRVIDEKEKRTSDRIDDSQPKELVASFSQIEASAIVTAPATANTIDTNWYQSSSDSYSLNMAEIVDYSASDNVAVEYNFQKGNYLGKILFSLAISYCLFVLWWLFGHQGSKLITAWMGGRQIMLSKSDAEFIDYAERSLETIERQIEVKKADAGEEEKVVYVPVYTPPTTPSLPAVSNLPLTALPSNSTSQIPQPVAVAEPTPEPLKIPAPPPLPTATPIESTEKIAIAKPEVKSTLIGILELGDNKSAALIKVKGKTRRVWLGETVNNEGWILESVVNQTANLSYQGQVRSVSVGEAF